MNIIDALVVTLRLDNTGFVEGAKQVIKATGDLNDGIESGAKRSDVAQKRLADGIRQVRNEALGFLLVLSGANGIKDFVSQIVSGDAATGRLATNLGISTEKLSAWQGAVGQVGGKAEDAAAAIQAMVTAQQNLRLTGSTGHDADFQGLGVTRNDLNDPANALLKMADAGERMGRPEFVARLSRIGIPESTINLLEKGRKGVTELLAKQEEYGVTTAKDAAAAQAFEASLAKLETIIRGAARPAIEGLTGDLDGLANNKGGIESFFSGVSAGAHKISVGFQRARASLVDFVTIWNDIRQGRWSDALQTFLHGSVEDVGKDAPAPAGGGFQASAFPGMLAAHMYGSKNGSVGATNAVEIERYLQAHGLSAEQARGVRAGITAEGGSLGMAANGAFGIGQWRGPRRRALMAKYGKTPSLEQQLAFLVAELKGGDPGGLAVLRAGTASQALNAYIRQFMRPAAGYETDRDISDGLKYLGRPRSLSSSGGAAQPSTTHIGTIVINTAATDGKGIARDLPDALRRRGLVIQSQSGMTP